MRKNVLLFLYILAGWFLFPELQAQKALEQRISDSLTVIASEYFQAGRINRIKIDQSKTQKLVVITAGENLGFFPFRPENVSRIYNAMNSILGATYPGFDIRVQAYGRNIEELIPVYYQQLPDTSRFFTNPAPELPLVTKMSQPFGITRGLQNRYIALWNSHGIYYHQNRNKWEWQRPLLFQTVEDMLTTAFVVPYLTPMLENSGARVFLPRERDIQTNEVIVDNDDNKGTRYREYPRRNQWTDFASGFANPNPYYLFGENPFRMGTSRMALTTTDSNELSRAEWTPDIPEKGMYAVYVAYQSTANSTRDARYTVFHAGGQTEFSVNQTMFGGSWLYLGHFLFDKGRAGKVVLTNFSFENDRSISADAVKFGGGMGNMARIPANRKDTLNGKPNISTFPRFMEGARYWLQWSGAPDSVYSRTGNTNDYSDDFQSRGFWVNYLAGGSSVNPNGGGLRVPLDMAFAFHTDAGIRKDTVVGTLGICTVMNNQGETNFKNGRSRWASRDLTDLIQSQIVNDIRKEFNGDWTRRGLWNRSYSESRNPEVPTMLLELLSHQNFEDMKYALDPRFRFVVSRSIYKAILRHFAYIYGYPYVVQPLPVESFNIRFVARNKIRLQWQPVADKLEPTAKATNYMLYTRIDDGGFDNGRVIAENNCEVTITPGKIYSFKVTAINEGGESFPSEVLTAYRDWRNRDVVMIINGFERISGPDRMVSPGAVGFLPDQDGGVPDRYDLSYIGPQYNFSPDAQFQDNENPGFGASRTDFQRQTIAGNTFDYPFIHGKAIKESGYSFVSASVKSVVNNEIPLNDYKVVNLILGKQKQIYRNNGKQPEYKTFPKELQRILRQYCEQGGNLMVSGSYVVSDLQNSKDEHDRQFAEKVLKVKPEKVKAASTGEVLYRSDNQRFFIGRDSYHYQAWPDNKIYFIEKPDFIAPADAKAFKICRINGTTDAGVGVAYAGKYKTCVFSIPFETIKDEESRNKLMNTVLHFFFSKR